MHDMQTCRHFIATRWPATGERNIGKRRLGTR